MPLVQSTPLPEFENPPIDEVAISVEFVPLSGWQMPHAGLYWARIKDRYPHTEVHPPLGPSPELPGGDSFQFAPPRFELVLPKSNRMWFISEDKVDVIQVQSDRFVMNWRKVAGDEVYPRFDNGIRPRFEREWGEFKRFVKENALGNIEIKNFEISYVNHIVKGREWNTVEEAMGYFSYINKNVDMKFLPSVETMNLTGSFRMPSNKGALSFAILHALRQRDKREIIQFTLTARGKSISSSDEDQMEWICSGRECIVRGFADLTTSEAHKLWRRVENG
ncbi:MAG TPA: TIGR04255 family protein [Methylobacter sp.]|jgi:uncharacterized protein (TIGR04255 family)